MVDETITAGITPPNTDNPPDNSEGITNLNRNTKYSFDVRARGDGVRYAAEWGVWASREHTTSTCASFTTTVFASELWPETEAEITLSVRVRGRAGDATRYQWQHKDSGRWTDIDESSARSETFKVKSNEKGPRTFRVKVTRGTETVVSGLITVTWVEGLIRKEENPFPWENRQCNRLNIDYDSVTVSSPHYAVIMTGALRLQFRHITEYWEDWRCVKARFGSETAGSLSVTVDGHLRSFEKELPTDSRTMEKLESDSLDIPTLRGLYRVSTGDTPARTPKEPINCTYCKGGFVETWPVYVEFVYLKHPVVKVSGNHRLDGGAKVVTEKQWETPRRSVPKLCKLADSSKIRYWVQSGMWHLREATDVLYSCSREYRNYLDKELRKDLPPDKVAGISQRVISQVILPWEES